MDTAAERQFREFVVARSAALMRLAYLLAGGDQHAAEDLLQIALAKTAARWAGVESPETYVRRVMYRQQVNSWRLKWDLGWSRNGTLIWAPTSTAPTKVFYDLNGRPRPAPAHEDEYDPYMHEAGLSPNGALLPKFGPRPGPAVTVRNVTTGKVVAVLPIQQARAWADDNQLFAIGCDPKKCTLKGEFRNRLLLVSLDGKITPLTGYQRSDRLGSWEPLFTHR